MAYNPVMNDPLILIIVFLFGIMFGSFLNVVIYRLPLEKSIVKPPSSCPRCGSRIKYYDNIPILSYLLLRGKCRQCEAKISSRYPAVEFLAGALSVFAIYHFGLNLKGIETLILSLAFIAIFFIDLDYTIIPDLITLPGIVIGFAVSFAPGAFINWDQSLIGLLVGGGSFYLVGMIGQFAFKKEALGLGDVKFAAMLGAFVGWQNLLLTLVLASFFGSVIGIIVMLVQGKGRKSYIPFGPFLVVGAWISIYFGDSIFRAYLDFVGL